MGKEHDSVILYGAGAFAEKNIERWKQKWNILCFADINSQKWGEHIGGIEIWALDEAIKVYPCAKIIISTDSRFKEIYSYLMKKGISEGKLSFVVPREKRMGCKWLGKCVQLDGGKIMKTCCFEKAYKQEMHDDLKTEYEIFSKKIGEINRGLKNHQPTSCDGCCMLEENWWEIEPKVEVISLASGFKDDVCNCKCIYCDARHLLQTTNDDCNISVLDACKFFSDDGRFDDVGIVINNGEFVLNKHRIKILEICERKNWKVTLFTNGIFFSNDMFEYMKNNEVTLICSVDAGTRKTFLNVKGVDKFEKVIKNLEKYSERGDVELKYILLKDVNDNFEDADGFVEIAKKFAHKVILSRDLFFRNDEFTMNERKFYTRVVKKIGFGDAIDIEFYEDCMPDKEITWIRNFRRNSKKYLS